MKKFLSLFLCLIIILISSVTVFASDIAFSIKSDTNNSIYYRGETYKVLVSVDSFKTSFAAGTLFFTLGDGLEYISSGFSEGAPKSFSGSFEKTIAGNYPGSFAYPVLSLKNVSLKSGNLCYITFKVKDDAPNKTFVKFFGYDLCDNDFKSVETNTAMITLTVENNHDEPQNPSDLHGNNPSGIVTDKPQNIKNEGFSDVPKSHWAYDHIMYLASERIVSGVGNGLFSPDRAVTRAEFIKMISGIVGINVEGYVITSFNDVKEDDWFMPYIAWAVDNGIATGTSASSFSPNKPVTREQAATFLYRLVEKYSIKLDESFDGSDFADNIDISGYASDAVYYMKRTGVINGVGNNKFNPKGTTTRAATCKMIALIIQK